MLTCGALGKAALDRLRQFLGRGAGELSRNGADEDLDELRPVAHVDVMQLAAQGDFVAPGRRQQMRVGIASDVAQQRLMIDVAPRAFVEARDLRKPHRQHAGSQREIPRMAGGQIRRIGQRHQKIGASNCRCRHVRSPPR